MENKKTEIEILTNEIVSFIQERNWEQFHKPKDTALALSIEASELNEVFLWKDEKDADFVVPFVKEHHRTPTFSDAIEGTRRQMIDKICKWLDDNAFEYVKTKTVGIDEIYKGFDSEKMITDLIKAMEGQV